MCDKWKLIERKTDEKWELTQRISHFLRTAPQTVTVAWRNNWTDITFYPRGYLSYMECGCSTGHTAGWYGRDPDKHSFIAWGWICGPNGETDREQVYAPEGYSCD